MKITDTNVPFHKGNQWLSYYKSGIFPIMTVIILGSNSVDTFDHQVRETENHTKDRNRFWYRATHDFNAAFHSITPQILNVLRVIRNNAPYSDLLYVKIIPHPYWHQLSRSLARRIDCFITGRLRHTHRIKEIWVHEVMFDRVERKNEIVLPGMLSTDEVHLNHNGNKALSKAIIRPVTSKWLAYKRYAISHKS